jgi:hypothetical protein
VYGGNLPLSERRPGGPREEFSIPIPEVSIQVQEGDQPQAHGRDLSFGGLVMTGVEHMNKLFQRARGICRSGCVSSVAALFQCDSIRDHYASDKDVHAWNQFHHGLGSLRTQKAEI